MIYSKFQPIAQPFLKVKDFLGKETSRIQKAFSPSHFTLKSPFSDRESVAQAVTAVALFAIGAIASAANLILGEFNLLQAVFVMVSCSCYAICLLAMSLLKEKVTVSISAPEPPLIGIAEPLEDEGLGSFQDLPSEMTQEIFNKLSTRDLVAMQGVCRTFYHLSKEQIILEKRKQLAKMIGFTAEIPDDQIDRYCAAAQNVKIYHQPRLIEALGGILAVEQLPCLKLPRTQVDQLSRQPWDQVLTQDHILFKSMSAPVMRGFDSLGRPFIIIKYRYNELDSPLPKTRILVLFQTQNIREWGTVASYRDPDYSGVSISKETSASLRLSERTSASLCLLGRISRLIKGEPVGRLIPFARSLGFTIEGNRHFRTLPD
ncbi:MAG: hypothetical protein K0S07_1719, partial [Chlamydiales bacterium]|nr:hypothetical protein [Chlamydiales bacterium]